MSAALPIIKCECGSDMRVTVIQATKDANRVTYDCLRCDGRETITVPRPKAASDNPAD
jgi:hypothetical protein